MRWYVRNVVFNLCACTFAQNRVICQLHIVLKELHFWSITKVRKWSFFPHQFFDDVNGDIVVRKIEGPRLSFQLSLRV